MPNQSQTADSEQISCPSHALGDAKFTRQANTPPTFAIDMQYALAVIEEWGGVTALEKENAAKAELLYGTIDANAGVRDRTRVAFSHPFSEPARLAPLPNRHAAAQRMFQMLGDPSSITEHFRSMTCALWDRL